MEATVHLLLATLTFGETRRHERLAIKPLFRMPEPTLAYITLSRALSSKRFSIREVSENGSVPELRLVNRFDEPVLLIDGEELTGAKQNRVLNATVLADARSELTIPVSCTEQGRWSSSVAGFADAGTVMTPRHRATTSADVRASLQREQSFRSNQQAVWANVREMHARLGTSSPTVAMRDAYVARRGKLDAVAAAVPCESGQSGIAVALDGRLVGLELVSRPEAYRDLHEKLVRSYAMESLLAGPDGASVQAGVEAISNFLAKLYTAEESRHRSVGLGWDYRYRGEDVVGSALVVEGEPVHVAFFPSKARGYSPGTGRIASPARRARFRS